MSLNLIAILVSLAMLLTGAGGEGKPAEASRVATLRNVVVTYNGETLRLSPEAHLGVSTDGERALFDFGVELDGDALLPIQLAVNGDGVKALFAGSGEAVAVSAGALEGLASAFTPLGQGEGGELLNFITDEYLPAYGKVLDVAFDPEAQAEIQKAARTAYDKAVDRGEGTPNTVEVEGETYDVTAYSYTLDGARLGALADAVYASVPALSDYYAAIFKLYSLLPEESGLTEIDSFAALFERTGIDVTFDVEERLSDDGKIDVMDAVLTLDPSALAGMSAEPEGDDEDDGEEAEEDESIDEDVEPEGDAEDDEDDEDDAPAQPEPIVIDLHGVQVGDFSNSTFSCDCAIDGESRIELSGTSSQEPGVMDVEMDMTLLVNDIRTQRGKLTLFFARDDEGGSSYSASLRNIAQDRYKLELGLYGAGDASGASENSVSFALRTAGNGGKDEAYPYGMQGKAANLDVSFDVDVTADAIANAVTDREASYTIDDLSDEDQLSDPALAELMTKVGGSLAKDVDRLTADKGVAKLTDLMNGGDLPIDVDDIDEDEAYDLTYDMDEGEGDYTYVIDDGDGMSLDMDDEPVEDDGKLDFDEPRLGWLPQGWSVADTDRDTAYDWVEMSIVDENGVDSAYAIFFADPEAGVVNYIVQEDGKVVEGREINVTDFGEGGLSVTVRESGIYGNVMFTSGAIDVETIGKIVAGIEF